jgi:hypothetical protein
MSRTPRGLLAALAALAVAAGWALAPPAGADAAEPTNFEARLERLDPQPAGARMEVVGGDAFLRVTARPGVEVEVPGYDGEPYLRIRRDGVVERNRRSPAVHLNASLTGEGPLPTGADSSAPPDWEPTGAVGTVAWHDHRIHWMLEEPPVPAAGGFVQRWTVAFTVDGEEVTATGVLRYRDDDWGATGLAVAGGLLAGAGTALVVRRRVDRPWSTALLAAAAVTATVVSAAALRANPPDAGASLLPTAVCGVALVLAVLAPAVRRPWVPLASVAILTGWALLRLPVLWRPVVPTTLPDWVDRGATAAVLAVAVVVGAALVRDPSEAGERPPAHA